MSRRLIRCGVAIRPEDYELTDRCELPDQLLGQLAAVDRARRPGLAHVEVVGDLDDELAAVQLHRNRAARAAHKGRNRGAACAGARRERLPHPALEDPCAHPEPSIRMNETLVRLGKSSERSIAGPIAPRSRSSSSSPASITHWGLPIDDVLEAPLAPAGVERARAVGPPEG